MCCARKRTGSVGKSNNLRSIVGLNKVYIHRRIGFFGYSLKKAAGYIICIKSLVMIILALKGFIETTF